MSPAPQTAAPVTPITFQSRWGSHPCDTETFLMLKELKKLWWKNVYVQAEWYRWRRKAPQNRVRKQRVWDRTGERPKLVSETVTPWREPQTWGHLFNFDVLCVFENARMPKSPDKVTPMSVSPAQISETLDEIRAFLGKSAPVLAKAA